MRHHQKSALRLWLALPVIVAVGAAGLLWNPPAAHAQLSRVGDSVAYYAAGTIRGTDTAHDPVNDVYLAVQGNGPVTGTFLGPSGNPVTPPFTIFDGITAWGKFPKVRYSPHVSNGAGGLGGFLVVWHQEFGPLNYVFGRVVALEAPGRVVTAPFAISDGLHGDSMYEQWPAIAYSQTSRRFLVVWATYQWSILGRFVDSSGTPIGDVMPLENPGGAHYPSMTWNPGTDEFGLAYSQFGGAGAWVSFRRIGAASGSVSARTSFGFARGTFATAIDVNTARQFIVAWGVGPGTHTVVFDEQGNLTSALPTFVSHRMGGSQTLGMAFNPVTGTFLTVSQDWESYEVASVELNGTGAPMAGVFLATQSAPEPYYPLTAARANSNHWDIVFSRKFNAAFSQIVASASVLGPACTVDGNATVPAAGTAGSPVAFAATATVTGCGGAAPAYTWTFGDGASSTQQNPAHAYAAAGTYAWTLTVTAGTGTATRTGTITVANPVVCTVNATATVPATGTVGSPVAFAATATQTGCGVAPSYAWAFGDGAGSAQQNPAHTYGTAGTYTWTLTATAGTGSATRTGSIVVSAPGACIPTTHTVLAQTQASLDAMWQNTGVGVTAGQLVTINAGGTWANGGSSWTPAGNASDPTVGGNSPMPGAPRMALVGRIGTTGAPFLVGASSQFTSGVSGQLFLAANDDWYMLWDNGGSLSVSACVGGAPCTVDANATVPATGMAGSPVAFAATATASGCGVAPSYSWAFGDGATSAQQNPVHAYAVAGTYTWTVTVQAATASTLRTGTIAITAPAGCAVDATATVPATGTVGSPVAFGATATVTGCGGAVPTYAWTFGDGASSAQQNPAYTYSSAETFTWMLTVQAGTASTTRTGSIVVSAPGACIPTTHTVLAQTQASLDAMWQNTGVGVTAGQLVTITASGTWTNAGTSWTPAGNASDPTFGGNSPMPGAPRMALVGRIGTTGAPFLVGASSQFASGVSGQLFLAANDDWYMLWDNGGSLSASVCVGGAPCTVDANATVPATATPGSPVAFTATATQSGCGVAPSYSWAFGDGATSTEQNPFHTYALAGAYTWTLTVQAATASTLRTGTIIVSTTGATFTVLGQPPASLAAMWQGTGVTVNAGEFVSVTVGAGQSWTNAGQAWSAAGNTADPTSGVNCPMPGAPRMALVGRIGPAGAPFLVGTSLQFTAGATGQLFLAPNDDWYMLWDNSGSLTVTIAK